jgi:hypothetical protein
MNKHKMGAVLHVISLAIAFLIHIHDVGKVPTSERLNYQTAYPAIFYETYLFKFGNQQTVN